MKMPKELLVYVFDYDKETGTPLYAVAKNVDEIPEDCHDEKVGNYVLNRISTFKVKRELK